MGQAPSAGERRAARLWALGVCLGIASAAFALGLGCGGSGAGVANARLPKGVRSQAVEHEACEESGHKVELVDVNNDGKPDIRRVYDGGRELCRISDLDRDGKPDMFEYYDNAGQLRRREADYDGNGIVNVIELYEDGKLARSEIDTSSSGRIDTWDTFDLRTGRRTTRERDTTGDGRIDEWWAFAGDDVTVTTDKDGDGRPDPGSEVKLQVPSGGAPVAPPALSADAGAQAGSSAVRGEDAGAVPPTGRGGRR